jgi:benzoyl-CoA reductase/2-hydroxyglutaryl-CoA dehydratase subunit BcrC/BadD/HgdB
MKTIGITTTVPIEVLLAAGYRPIDLNNVFVSEPDPRHFVAVAEQDGFPVNCCAWIKGIYGVAMERNIDTVMCVTTGDCSNTEMLMEVLRLKGLNAIPFAYPQKPDTTQMLYCLESLAESLGTTLHAAENERKRLERARAMALELDGLTWQGNVVSGWENHYWLVAASDFNGDVGQYERGLNKVLKESRKRKPYSDDMLRLAFIGVPPIFGRDLYDFLERNGGRVVFNETQRQFAMLNGCDSLAEQYTKYTYPYSLSDKLDDILPQMEQRRVDGVLHYVQTFCHRGIGNIIFRHRIDMPVLTLEGNNDYTLSQQARNRIETFLEVLEGRRSDATALSTEAAKQR